MTHDAPTSDTTRGEWYLYSNYQSFIGKLRDNLAPSSGIAYGNLHFRLNEDYGSGIKTPLSGKFGSIKDIIKAYQSSASTMTSLCSTLDSIVKDTRLDVGWLVDSGESEFKEEMHGLFSEKTWPEEKLDMFVGDAVDNLVGSYRLLEYFQDYLVKHLTHDLTKFNNAASDKGDINIVNGDEVVESVQTYIASKVPTALVLGGYVDSGDEDNARYPGIGQYLQNTERKISKVQAQDIMSPTNAFKEVAFAVQSTKLMNDCDSFSELMSKKDRDDLFTMTQNASFVALSNLVKPYNQDTLNVNWDTLKS